MKAIAKIVSVMLIVIPIISCRKKAGVPPVKAGEVQMMRDSAHGHKIWYDYHVKYKGRNFRIDVRRQH